MIVKAIQWLFITFSVVALAGVIIGVARLGPHASVSAATGCQRYADSAVAELTKSLDALGATWMNVSTQRAQAWAILYLGRQQR